MAKKNKIKQLKRLFCNLTGFGAFVGLIKWTILDPQQGWAFVVKVMARFGIAEKYIPKYSISTIWLLVLYIFSELKARFFPDDDD